MEERRVRQGYDVVDSNGAKIGTVGDVFATYFRVDTGFLGLGKDYFIPFSAVDGVSRNQVSLGVPKERLDSMGFDRRPMGGLGVSGTEATKTRETHEHPAAERQPSAEDVGVTGERVMRLREEELEARRHTEKVGEVQITKEVHEERRRINVPYTEEKVHIERRPVSPESAESPAAQGENEIHVPIYEEEVEITKRPVVREEIVISKERVTRERPVEETVRREVPRIRKEGDVEIEAGEENLTDEERLSHGTEESKRPDLRQ